VIKVKFTNSDPTWPFIRQTEDGNGKWKDCQFYINEKTENAKYDYWVVYSGLFSSETIRCSKKNTIFIAGEPPNVHCYNEKFLNQFGVVLGSQRNSKHPHFIHQQQGLPWHVGVLRKAGQGGTDGNQEIIKMKYRDFKKTIDVEKIKDISVICSDKSMTPNHKLRIKFVKELKNHFGNRLDWYGRGYQPIADKWDAIAPYKFHISLESYRINDYWSEKLSDSYLAETFPIYYGCSNLEKYFPLNSYIEIDISDTKSAINTIENILSKGLSTNQIDAVKKAKNDVLEKYNIFPLLVDLFKTIPKTKEGSTENSITILPESKFISTPSLKKYIKTVIPNPLWSWLRNLR